MSSRASGIVLLVLSFPLLMLGIAAWNEANHESGVRASRLAQSVSAPDPRDRADFARYADSTLDRQASAEKNRNWLLALVVMSAGAGIVLMLPRRRREAQDLVLAATISAASAPPPAGPAQTPAMPVNKLQRAFYVLLMVGGLVSAVVIYTVMFNNLSEEELVQISPYWIFPIVFGYYGLVAQRMEAKLPTTHLDNVSDQLLSVIKEIGGPLGQGFAFLVHAPFLIVKNQRPWVVAFVGSLIWAMALLFFFNVIFPEL